MQRAYCFDTHIWPAQLYNIYLQLQFLDKIRRVSGFETVPAGSMRLGDDVVVSGYRIEALIGFDHVRDTLPVDQGLTLRLH